MNYQIRPLTLNPDQLSGLSSRLITSHHENNYAGAVKRLNALRGELAALDWNAAATFTINGLKREELIAANSAFLHELYFDNLGGERRAAFLRVVHCAHARLWLCRGLAQPVHGAGQGHGRWIGMGTAVLVFP